MAAPKRHKRTRSSATYGQGRKPAPKQPYTCDRPQCQKAPEEGWLYCSQECYDLDNDPIPITVVARNKAGGFGHELHWQTPDEVRIEPSTPKRPNEVDVEREYP